MKKSFVPAALLSLAFITACESPIKTTEAMKNTTDGMARTTNAMNSKVENTDENSAKLGMLMAQGNASEARDNQFKKMRETKVFMEKMDYAVKFVDSFEFQIFSDEGLEQYDTEELLEIARQEAIKEIPKKLNGAWEKVRNGISGTESNDEVRDFFAVACALHYKNSKQAEFRKQMGIPTESLLDLIVEGLKRKDDIRSGKLKVEDLRKFEREVLKEEAFFVRMLEVRHKFIPAMAIARISNLDYSVISKLDMLLTKTWRPTFLDPKKAGEMNSVELDYIAEMLSHAVYAKDVLNKQGRKSELDSKIVKIIIHMDLRENAKTVKLDPVDHEYVKRMENSFAELLKMEGVEMKKTLLE